MPTYRKRKYGKTWHWCTNCNNWPPDDSDYDERDTKPTSSEICDECRAKERNETCSK